eukprot:7205492-Prymnesium_polylepis.1
MAKCSGVSLRWKANSGWLTGALQSTRRSCPPVRPASSANSARTTQRLSAIAANKRSEISLTSVFVTAPCQPPLQTRQG